MSEKVITAKVKFEADLQDMQAGIAEVEKQLNNLQIPGKFTEKTTKDIENLKTELQSLALLEEKGSIDLVDEKSARESIKKIDKLYADLIAKVRGVDLVKVDTKSGVSAIHVLENAAKSYGNKVKVALSNWSNTSGLNQAKKKSEELADAAQKAQAALAKKADATPGIDKAYEQYTQLKTKLNEATAAFEKATKAKQKYDARWAEKGQKAQQIKGVGTYYEGEVNTRYYKTWLEAGEAVKELRAQLSALTSQTSGGANAIEAYGRAYNTQVGAVKSLEKAQTDYDALVKKQAVEEAQITQQAMQETVDYIKQKLAEKGLELDIDVSSITSIEDLNGVIEQLNTAMQQAALEGMSAASKGLDGLSGKSAKLREKVDEADVALRQMQQDEEDIESISNGFQNFFKISNAVTIFRNAIKQAYNTVKELDAVMTETAVVTRYTISDMWEQLPEYTERANALGVSIESVYESATLFYQQGLSTNQVMQVSNETMKMARIASLDAAEATDRMTNALRGFNMEINETNAKNINDVYSNLAAISASNVDEISTAMTKVASLASNANMSFENTSAFLAQIIETTRESAETAGTALKTVIARFSEVKSLYSTGDLTGEDENGEEIDVNKVSKALRTAGINLNEYLTGAVGLDDIFMQLSERWDDLDQVQQRYIATMAAGSRQQSRFIALMQDNARMTYLVEEANNSAGASQKQYEKTLDSLESKLNILSNAWNTFVLGLSNSSIIKSGVDVLSNLLNLINTITNAFGESGGNVIKVVAAIAGFKLGKTLFTNDLFKNVINSFKNMGFHGGESFKEGFERQFAITGEKGVLNDFKTMFSSIINLAKGFGESLGKKISTGTKKGVQKSNKKLKFEDLISGNADAGTLTNELNKEIRQIMMGSGQEPKKVKISGADSDIANNRQKVINKFGEDSKQLEEYDAAVEKYRNALIKAKGATDDLGDSSKKAGITIKDLFGGGSKDLNEFEQSMARCSNYTIILGTALSVVGEQLQNVDSEPVKKAGEAISKIGTSAIVVGGILRTLPGILKTISTSFKIDAASLAGIAPTIAGAITAIGALVALVQVIGVIVEDDDERLKRLQETAEKTKEEMETAEDNLDSLLDAKSKYSESIEALKTLTKGTQDWRDAMDQVQTSVNTLLQEVPELAQFIQIGEDGTIGIDWAAAETYLRNEETEKTVADANAQVAVAMQDIDNSTEWEVDDVLNQIMSHWASERFDGISPEEVDWTNDPTYSTKKESLRQELVGYKAKDISFGQMKRNLYEDYQSYLDGYLPTDISNDLLAQQLPAIQTMATNDGLDIDATALKVINSLIQKGIYVKDDKDRSGDTEQGYKDLTVVNEGTTKGEYAILTGGTDLGNATFSELGEKASFTVDELEVYDKLEGVTFDSTNGTLDINGTEIKLDRQDDGTYEADSFLDSTLFASKNKLLEGLTSEKIINQYGSFTADTLNGFLAKGISSKDASALNRIIAKYEGTDRAELSSYINSPSVSPNSVGTTMESLLGILNSEDVKTYMSIAIQASKNFTGSVEDVQTAITSINDTKSDLLTAIDNLKSGKGTAEDMNTLNEAGYDVSDMVTGIEGSFTITDEQAFDLNRQVYDGLNYTTNLFLQALENAALNFINEETISDFNLGTTRREIKGETMRDAGYSEFSDGDTATVYTHIATQIDENGEEHDYVITPIIKDGDGNYYPVEKGVLDGIISQISNGKDIDQITLGNGETIEDSGMVLGEFDSEDAAEQFAQMLHIYEALQMVFNETGEYNWDNIPEFLPGNRNLDYTSTGWANLPTESQQAIDFGTSMGLNEDDIKELTESLQQFALNDAGTSVFEDYTGAIEDFAVQALLAQQALEDFDECQEELEANLKSDNEITKIQALSQLQDILQKTLGTSQEFSRGFLENDSTLQYLKDIAAGGEAAKKALINLRKAAASDLINRSALEDIDDLQAKIDQLVDETYDVDIGVTISDEGYKALEDVFNDLVDKAKFSSEEIESFFNGIGWEPVITWEKVTDESTNAVHGEQTVYTLNEDGTYSPSTLDTSAYSEGRQTYYIPKLSGARSTTSAPPPTGSAKASSGGGGGGSSGGSGSSTKKSRWENPYDKLYNLTEKINEALRQREALERKYDRILRDRQVTYDALRKNTLEEINNLRKEIDYQKQLQSGRKQQIQSIGNETFTDSEGTRKTYTNWGVTKYAKYNFDTNTIEIDWDAINKVTNTSKGAAIEDYIDRLEELVESYEDTDETIENMEDTLYEIKNQYKESYIELEDRIYEALVQREQDIIDNYQDIADQMKESNDNILNSLNESIDYERQIRDNTEKEEEISEIQRRLAYLRLDTSGANDLEIMDLEDQLEDKQQDYADTLVDQSINAIKDSNDKAEEQRQRQIDIMQENLDYAKENGEFWDETYEIISNSIDPSTGELKNNSYLVELLKETDAFQGMSEFGQFQWIDDLISDWAEAQTGLAEYKVSKLESVGTYDNNGEELTYDKYNQVWTNANGAAYNIDYDTKTGSYNATPTQSATVTSTSSSSSDGPWFVKVGAYSTPATMMPKEEVEYLQKGLNAIGITLPITGVYDDNTILGVKKLQKKLNGYLGLNLSVNGQYTSKVRKYTLNRYNAYQTGGLADYTGPAWLDGTKSNPELVLNANDTKNFLALTDALRKINIGDSEAQNSGDNYYEVHIDVDELANDYDVEQLADKVMRMINDNANYRNVNAVSLMR